MTPKGSEPLNPLFSERRVKMMHVRPAAIVCSMNRVMECIGKFRAAGRDRELEVRMGTFQSGRFVAGVERDVFEHIFADLREAAELQDDDTWSEVIDYHYTEKGARARTRVTFDSQLMGVNTEHICKTTESDVLLKHAAGEETGFRIAFATETPLVPPSMCNPTFVRIKQRRSFRDVRHGSTVWRYELSKTWSGKSRSEVERRQHVSPPVYEVECELVDDSGQYLASRDDAYIAKSVMLKAQMLLGEYPDAEGVFVVQQDDARHTAA